MDLAHTLVEFLPAAWTQSTAEIDAEIREELEFHLDMRTEENIRAGMTPDEARQDAQQRFGDFESSHRACRQITLGPRLLLRRVQTALLAVLVGVVVYQAVVMMRMQSATQHQIESLNNTILELQAAQQTVPTAPPAIALTAEELDHWTAARGALQHPWCDWAALKEPDEKQ